MGVEAAKKTSKASQKTMDAFENQTAIDQKDAENKTGEVTRKTPEAKSAETKAVGENAKREAESTASADRRDAEEQVAIVLVQKNAEAKEKSKRAAEEEIIADKKAAGEKFDEATRKTADEKAVLTKAADEKAQEEAE